MRVFLRKIVARSFSAEKIKWLKKAEKNINLLRKNYSRNIDHEKMNYILRVELGIERGDNLIVHGAFNNIKTNLSVDEVVGIILDIVGDKGTVAVPTFCVGSSARFLKSDKIFDARKTRSGMGAISENIRCKENAYRSCHPTKSIAAVGPLACDLVSGHEKCDYPFGVGSPFEMMYTSDFKIVGVGCALSYLSLVHVAEDCSPHLVVDDVWEKDLVSKECVSLDGRHISVPTRHHNMDLMAKADPEKFMRKYLPGKYRKFSFGLATFFSVSSRSLTDEITRQMKRGNSIYR